MIGYIIINNSDGFKTRASDLTQTAYLNKSMQKQTHKVWNEIYYIANI